MKSVTGLYQIAFLLYNYGMKPLDEPFGEFSEGELAAVKYIAGIAPQLEECAQFFELLGKYNGRHVGIWLDRVPFDVYVLAVGSGVFNVILHKDSPLPSSFPAYASLEVSHAQNVRVVADGVNVLSPAQPLQPYSGEAILSRVEAHRAVRLWLDPFLKQAVTQLT